MIEKGDAENPAFPFFIIMPMKMTDYVEKKIAEGERLTEGDLEKLLASASVEEILDLSHRVTLRFAGKGFDTCSIINAKSGNCSEDCKWCAQSVFHNCDIDRYPLVGEDECVGHAIENYRCGIGRFSIVTSGKRVSKEELDRICGIVRALKRKTNVAPCVSLGLIDEDDMRKLSEAGIERYHCNIESSPEFFRTLCTTHTVEDKLKVLGYAVKYGIEPCSGGIVGMGESMRDRIAMALLLRDSGVKSIPLNILNPIKGTALEGRPVISPEEYLLTVAVFRLANPDAWIRFSGGRALIPEAVQKKALYAGINAAIMGNMLTTAGADAASDMEMFADAGYSCRKEHVREHIWHPYSALPNPFRIFKVASAQGVRLELEDGRRIIDGMSSWWAAALGYNNPRLNAAAENQIAKMSHVMFGGLVHDPAIKLAETLLPILPEGLDRIFYADSGSVSVEVAMKMAIQYQVAGGRPSKNKFMTVRGGYHGDTWNAMSVCDPVGGMHSLFGPSLPVNYFLPRPSARFGEPSLRSDIDAMEEMFELHADELAAFILEPVVQGAGGMWFYSADYLKSARELCDRYGVLLVFDEIATGFGRTGRMFASEHAGVVPDIMTIGKALTGGYMTMAATVTTEKVAFTISGGNPGLFMHGPTFMANPLACAVSREAVRIYRSMDLQGTVSGIEKGLRNGLSPLKGLEGVSDVRVLGAIGVVEMERNVDMNIIEPMFVENGVWLRPFGRLVYTMPQFVITEQELSELCSGIVSVVKEYVGKYGK